MHNGFLRLSEAIRRILKDAMLPNKLSDQTIVIVEHAPNHAILILTRYFSQDIFEETSTIDLPVGCIPREGKQTI